MKRILCYGDSNTWGHVPAKGTRYDDEVRWPGVTAAALGVGYRVVEDSISGRTTLLEDPILPNRNGKDALGYALLAHAPIDLFVLALGGNDLKFTDAAGVRRNIERMIDLIRNADELYYSFSPVFRGGKKILLIAPPQIADEIATLRPGHSLAGAAEQSKLLPGLYAQVAQAKDTYFLDASRFVQPTLDDCIHLSPEGHRTLGLAVAAEVQRIFE